MSIGNKIRYFINFFLTCEILVHILIFGLLNLSFDMGVVPMDWRGACIVPLYKGKGDKYECSDSRGISLLSAVGKLFGRVLIEKVRA